MILHIRPILSALGKHRIAAALIVLEVALSCAITCNVLFLISGRLQRMQRPSGAAEREIIHLRVGGLSPSQHATANRDDEAYALTRSDLEILRRLPGVSAATATTQVPFGGSATNIAVSLTDDQSTPSLVASVYMGDEQLLDTLGVKLIAGRKFGPDDVVDFGGRIPAAIVTRSMARRLFPDLNPNEVLGKTFLGWSDQTIPIVGVIETLTRPNELGGPTSFEYSIVFPVRVPYSAGGSYLLRVKPEQRVETLDAARTALERNSKIRIILERQIFEEMRDKYYQQDRSMAWLLGAVCISLLVITMLGVVGLASFWVEQRTTQIGVRRALGATKGQILRYFQIENLLLTTFGIIFGMLLAYAINQLLMAFYELPRLPIYYLPAGAVTLWVIGQAAVLWPALQAASLPPAIATRGG